MRETVRVIKQFFLGSNCYTIRDYKNAPQQLIDFAKQEKHKAYAYIVEEQKGAPKNKKLTVPKKSAPTVELKQEPEVIEVLDSEQEVKDLGGETADVIYMPTAEYRYLKSVDQEKYITSVWDNMSIAQLKEYRDVSKAKISDLITDKIAELE